MAVSFPLRCLLLALSLSPLASPALAAPSACAGEPRRDRLQALTPEGDLVLAESGLARLAQIRLPDTAPHREKALTWLRERIGRTVLMRASEGRDRWDRLALSLGTAEEGDFARELVRAGLALVDPTTGEASCAQDLLGEEESARTSGLGLWADARYKPVKAEETDLLRDRIGRFVLVEGRIASVGERRQQTYLNFGEHWADDFTIVIPQRTWKAMTGKGLGASAWRGRWIRARGILQSWQGTALTIVIPEAIERIDHRRMAR